ncbi:hypothetical protein HanPI659440_Chr02g0084291 [Helianthus annuus]|nr:hypothetical protein HanPI659440_Chr02g0084291 [Helianthus annuus]
MAMGDKYGGLVPKKKPLISKASKSTIYTKINQSKLPIGPWYLLNNNTSIIFR